MGTSMMIVIQKDKDVKVAQYFNFDGSPLSEGLGVFKSIKLVDMSNFEKQVSKCRFFSKEESSIIKKQMNLPISKVTIDIPNSLMQPADKFIDFIDESKKEKLIFINEIEALDYVNYVYFINFDTNSYEIYYNKFSQYDCNKECLKIGDIKYTTFKRIFHSNLSNLCSLKEYKESL